MWCCPNCGAEYRPGFTRCSDCNVDLVERSPEVEPGDPDLPIELTVIFRASDAGVIALVHSILDGAGIPFYARGEELQDVIGGGRIGAYNLVSGPAEFMVRGADADEARQLLAEL